MPLTHPPLEFAGIPSTLRVAGTGPLTQLTVGV